MTEASKSEIQNQKSQIGKGGCFSPPLPVTSTPADRPPTFLTPARGEIDLVDDCLS